MGAPVNCPTGVKESKFVVTVEDLVGSKKKRFTHDNIGELPVGRAVSKAIS